MAALAVYNKEGNKQIEALAQMHSDARYSYSFALVLVFFAAVLRLVFLPALGVLAIFVTFFPAVMLASLYGGFSAGFLATSATALIVDYLWFEPIGSLRINNFQERAALAIFLVVGTVMAWISHILREKNVRLRSIEAARREDLERLVAERTSELSKEIRVRRQIEAALIAALDESGRSKAELAAILDIAPVAIRIARDACCNIVKDNKTASDLLRSPRQSENCTQQFCGFPFRVVDEFMEEIPASHLPLDRATKGEQVKGDEFNLLFEDGTLRRCTSNAEPLRDEHGTVIGAVAIYLDITERKRAEESLRKSQARLETFVRDAPVSMAMFDRNMNYLAHSDRWIGSGHASLVGRNHFEVFPDLPDAWKRSYQQSLAGASLRNDESFWVRDDGKNEWLRRSVVPWTDENGKIGGIIVFTEDITERKNAIENLRESEARTRLLEKTLMQAVIYRDRDGKIIRANPAAEMILGRSVAELKNTSPEELFGQHLREDGSPFSPDEQPFATALRSGKIVSKVVMGIFNPRKSAYRWVSVDAIPLFRSGEDIPYEVYTVSTDITEAVETNKALAAAKAEAERANLGKSRFLAAASHDLRQPVQSLALLLSALDRHVVKRPHAAKTMDMMKSAVDGLSGLLNGILDISRLDADMVVPEMKGVDVGELVGDLAREYAPAAANKGLSLRSCHHASPAWTDPGLLERVLRNLIENALRYTTEGGILLGLRKRGNRIRIDVIDSGIGIACDSQTKIFEEFYQANVSAHEGRQGMGLGLSIVARIARLLNAEVHVVSELGRGSRFSVLLPFADNVCVKATDLPSELIDPGGRILVIEDNAVLREGFKLVLEAWGYEVLTAACDKDAIDIALRENWQLDAIVTDYQLGRGLTGIATAKEIERRARRTFPTIVITGDTAADRIAEAHAIVLHKPVRAEDLRCSLAQILETEMVRIVSGA
jgi:PAS domain S-box-containing protein